MTDTPVELVCSVLPSDTWGPDLCYVVRENGTVVASGVSSSLSWVKHDAGGYHTRSAFDDRYGPGRWVVRFEWEP